MKGSILKGDFVGRGKLTEEQKVEIIQRIYTRESGVKLAHEFKVNPTNIYALFTRRTGTTVAGLKELKHYKHKVRIPMDYKYFIETYRAKLEILDDNFCILVIE